MHFVEVATKDKEGYDNQNMGYSGAIMFKYPGPAVGNLPWLSKLISSRLLE